MQVRTRGRREREIASQLFLLAAQFFLIHYGRESFGLGASVAAEETSASPVGPDDEGFGFSTGTANQDASDTSSTSFPGSDGQGEITSPVDGETTDISSTNLSQDEVSSAVTGGVDQQTAEVQSTIPGSAESRETTDAIGSTSLGSEVEGELAGASDQQTSDILSTGLPQGEENGEVTGPSEVNSTSLPQGEEYGEVAGSSDQPTFDTQSTGLPNDNVTNVMGEIQVHPTAISPPNFHENEMPIQTISPQSQQPVESFSTGPPQGAQSQLGDRVNEIKQQILEMPSVFLDPLAQIALLMEGHSLALTAEQHLRAHACCRSGSTSCPEGCAVTKSGETPGVDDTVYKTETFAPASTTLVQA